MRKSKIGFQKTSQLSLASRWEETGNEKKAVAILFFAALFLFLSFSESFGQTTVDWWLMVRHDPAHTGYSTSSAPNTNQTLWVSKISWDSGTSSPAIFGGKVYTGCIDNKTYCLDAYDGTVLWNFTTSGYMESSPAIDSGKVYISSVDGKLFCLDASTGIQIWNTTGGNWLSSPVVVEGKIFIGSFDKNVYCLNASTGAQIWKYTTGNQIGSSPAVVNGKVYIGSDDGNIYCLDALTGTRVWALPLGGWVYSPAVADGKVYVGLNRP